MIRFLFNHGRSIVSLERHIQINAHLLTIAIYKINWSFRIIVAIALVVIMKRKKRAALQKDVLSKKKVRTSLNCTR